MDQDPELEKLDAMSARIKAAEHHVEIPAENDPIQPLKISGIGFDLVGAVLVCAFLGWLIDKGFGTNPWGLVAMIFVGFLVGITNVWRSLGSDKKD